MTHYDVRYTSGTREELDAKALNDLREYLGDKKFAFLVECANATDVSFQQLDFALSVAGVSGRPVNAFFRKYRLAEYRAWMADDSCEGPTLTDEAGFALEKVGT